jgi:hypothetical protein
MSDGRHSLELSENIFLAQMKAVHAGMAKNIEDLIHILELERRIAKIEREVALKRREQRVA